MKVSSRRKKVETWSTGAASAGTDDWHTRPPSRSSHSSGLVASTSAAPGPAVPTVKVSPLTSARGSAHVQMIFDSPFAQVTSSPSPPAVPSFAFEISVSGVSPKSRV